MSCRHASYLFLTHQVDNADANWAFLINTPPLGLPPSSLALTETTSTLLMAADKWTQTQKHLPAS